MNVWYIIFKFKNTHHLPNFVHIFHFFPKILEIHPIVSISFQFFPKIFLHLPIFVQIVLIYSNIFWHPVISFILVHQEFFYFMFKLLKLLKKRLFNGQMGLFGASYVITSEKIDTVFIQK